MNANGLRLLSQCSEHNLTTSWMHPRSKQWHLLDYVIVKDDQKREVHITRAMRGADCWTDHRMIMSKMNLRIRPAPPRRNQGGFKKINCAALKNDTNRQRYAEEVRAIVQDNREERNLSAEDDWGRVSERLLAAAMEILGPVRNNHRDWFNECGAAITTLLAKTNRAHTACLRNPSSVELRQRFAELRAETQTRLREFEDSW